MWKKIFNKKTIYIGLFAILYLACAWVSIYHAIAFFGLANDSFMATMLAVTFEIGQAAVLFSLLTSKKDRSKVLPWVLMFIFTLVQVLGNVFSSYEYLLTHSMEMLKYFKEPIFIWTDLPDDQCNVILSYLLGGLLPITCLALTSMITNFIGDEEKEKLESLNLTKKEIENIEKNNDELDLITDNNDELYKKIEEYERITKSLLNEQPSEENTSEESKLDSELELENDNTIKEEIENLTEDAEVPIEKEMIEEEEKFEIPVEDNSDKEIEVEENPEVNMILNGEAIPQPSYIPEEKKESKFINL